MTRATNARLRGPAEITLSVLPKVEPVDRLTPRRGETIATFVRRSGWQERGLPVVCAQIVGGKAVPVLRKDWKRRIKANDNFVFIAQPLGGGGGGGGSKSIGSILAMIAVIALSSIIAGPAGFLAGAGFGQVSLSIASAIIIAGGSLLISHFLAPKSGAKGEVNDPLAVNLSGNKARPQQPIPVHYGRLKFFPDFSTSPWGDYSGQNQVFHGLYCLGAGEFEVEEIGIGSTPVWTASGGTSPDFPTFVYEIIAPDQAVTLFPANVAVSPDVTGQQLPDPTGAGTQYIGPFIINSPGSVGRDLSIDLVWPGGAYTMDGTNTRPASTPIRVDYRYVSDVGTPLGGGSWTVAYSNTFTLETKVAFRTTVNVTLPTAGRVQVRVARTNYAITGTGTSAVLWAGARLNLYGATTRPKVTQIAVKLVADKQLSSYNSKQLYVVATRKIPVWNGTAWSDAATANPVWAAVDMWHNADYGGGQSRSNIDLTTITAQAAAANTRGDTFNHRFTSESTILDALTLILRSMLAQPVYVWDRLSIIRDEERTLPRLLLTDFEIIRGSPSVVYRLQDDQTSDGTIVEYLEEQTWSRADVSSAASLSSLVHPARVQIEGVTNRRQAVLCARYLAAVNRYRRTVLSLTIEAEGKLLRRGDLVAVQTEMPGTWGEALRVESYNSATRALTFHAAATWSASGNHFVRLKSPAGKAFGPVKVTKGAADNIAILDATDLTTVQTQQATTIAAVLARTDVEELPTAAFSAGQPREFLGLVSRMGNAGEGRFTLDLVNDAPEVYEIDDSAVPVLPTAPALIVPAVPGAIAGIYASLFQAGITLSLSAAWRPDRSSQTYTAQASLDDGASWTTIYPAGYDTAFQVSGFGDRDVLLRIRGTSPVGIDGPWTSVLVETPGLSLNTDSLGIGISPGAVEAQSFASGIEPVAIYATLPTASTYVGPSLAYQTSDGKLYKFLSGAWTSAAAASFSELSGTISSGQIGAGAVTTAAIAAAAIEEGKLAAGAVTSTKVSAGAITAGKIAAGAVTATEIAAGAVTAGKIAASSITATEIASSAITSDLLAANSVIAGKIAAGAVSASAISTTTLSAIAANLGTVTAGVARDSGSKFIIDFTNGNIKVYDASGVLRVQIGNLA